MKTGFYTALGTPLDEQGYLVTGSFKKHVEDQVAAGASGLLALGSMGNQPTIRSQETPKVAKACVEAAGGTCPVLVGVMDNSIARVTERIQSLKGIKIDGVVATTPFYYVATQDELKNFYTEIARQSPFPLFLYDLPGATKIKLAVETCEALIEAGVVKGIKTGDMPTARVLLHSDANDGSFEVIFSGLDLFDVAYCWGLNKNLDGMFSMTPKVATRLYKSLEAGDMETARKELDIIVNTRIRLFEVGIFRGFSEAMNLLGYEGKFAPDYCRPMDAREKDFVKQCMKDFGLM